MFAEPLTWDQYSNASCIKRNGIFGKHDLALSMDSYNFFMRLSGGGVDHILGHIARWDHQPIF